MRFTVFTHVIHQKKHDRFYGYAPYIREMNLWLKQVDEVEIVAPAGFNLPLENEISYKHHRIIFTKVPTFQFLSVKNSIRAFVKIPFILWAIFKAMKRTDHIHLRCPGNIGLLACVVQVFFPKKPKTAKYAGNWNRKAKQPWTYKLQKRILKNTFLTRNMQVLVYGDWPGQTDNIKPFFTASFSENEIIKGSKEFTAPFKFLFVGNLVQGKQPKLAIKLVEILKNKGLEVTMDIYGDGILKTELEAYCKKNNLTSYIRLHGNTSLEKLKIAYKEAHFLILLSQSEGWPKAVAEAMFFGSIPIASAVSCVPWILGFGKRGLIATLPNKRVEEPAWKEQLANRISVLANNPDRMKEMSQAAQKWSQKYTLERFEKGINEVMKR